MAQASVRAEKVRVILSEADAPIRTTSRQHCYVCGSKGDNIYEGLRDRLYGVDGEWTMVRCRNQGCQLLWLDPMPVEADLGKLYQNYSLHQRTDMPRNSLLLRTLDRIKRSYYAGFYGYRTESDWVNTALSRLAYLLPGYRSQWDFDVFYLPSLPHGRLLDVGCGSGMMMKRMAELGWQVQGIDFAPKAVEVARSQGLDVRLGGLDEQGFDEDSFDAVVMSHVIEHVSYPRELLANCYRLLKPGGHLVSITPNASSWGHHLYQRNWTNLDPPRHLHVFTVEAMAMLAEECGFRRARVTSVPANAHGVLWSSRQLKRHDELLWERYSAREAIWARAMQQTEWLRLWIDPDAGEEIVLRATK